MPQYTITWTIELSASTPEWAALEALDSIVNGTARIFVVTDDSTKESKTVDTEELDIEY